MDDETVYEQKIFEHYKKIESENFHLKNQLSRKNREIKKLKRIIKELKESTSKTKKQHYKNGKRGTFKNG